MAHRRKNPVLSPGAIMEGTLQHRTNQFATPPASQLDTSLSTGLTTVLWDRMRCKEMSLWNDASGNWYA